MKYTKLSKELKEDILWMGVEGSTGYAHDVNEAMIALRAIGETRAGSSPAARILFLKYLKHLKSNIKIES